MKRALLKAAYLIAIALTLAGVRYYANFESSVLAGLALICAELFYKTDNSQ